MKGFLKRLRGIIGSGLTGEAGWGAAFVGLWAEFGLPFSKLAEAAFTGMGLRRSDTKLIEGEEESVLSLEGDDEPLPALEGK